MRSILSRSILSRSQTAPARAGYVAYENARPILETLREILPEELRAKNPADLPSAWPKWVTSRDAEIRARLVQGDEDSVINFMLFGTSFTRKPRITLKALAEVKQNAGTPETAAFAEVIQARAGDLIQGIVTPGNNERLLFARRLARVKGL